jgi:hypothetical protein
MGMNATLALIVVLALLVAVFLVFIQRTDTTDGTGDGPGEPGSAPVPQSWMPAEVDPGYVLVSAAA